MGEPGTGESGFVLGEPQPPPNIFGEHDIPDIREQAVAAERIKNRDAMDIRNNFERSMKGINDFYVEQQIQLLPQRFKLIPRPVLQKYFSHKLRSLAESFGEDFNTTVFSDIVHFSYRDLGEEVDLKSPALIAKEAKVLLNKVPDVRSGGVDEEIGTTEYVFGASEGLPARQTGNAKVGSDKFDYKSEYKIESEDCYAVPADITVVRPYKPGQGQMNFSIYADNVFALQDFKKLLPTYCAALFESPKMALKFLRTFAIPPMDIWFRVNDPKFIPGVATDIDSDDYLRKTLQDMKQILINADVYPPFCPEFQFRDHVKAKRVEQDKVQT